MPGVQLLGASFLGGVFTMFKSKQAVFLMWKNWKTSMFFLKVRVCVCFFWRIPDNLHWFWKLVGQMPGKFQTLAIEYIKRLVLLWKLTQNTTGVKLKDDVPFNRGWVLRLDATFWGSISTKKNVNFWKLQEESRAQALHNLAESAPLWLPKAPKDWEKSIFEENQISYTKKKQSNFLWVQRGQTILPSFLQGSQISNNGFSRSAS